MERIWSRCRLAPVAAPSGNRRAALPCAFRLGCFALAAAILTAAPRVAAQVDQPADSPPPPPITSDEFHYGVALVFEPVLDPGGVCPGGAAAPCILGSGGGVAVRFGYRTRGPFWFGGAYEFSRRDAANLLRLPVLQHLRAEARYYLDRGMRLTPYVSAALGAALYGSEWGADTAGIGAGAGAGVEFEVSRTAVVGAALLYRPLLLRRWVDTSGQARADDYLGFGLAHLAAIELTLTLRDPLPRW